MHDITAEKEAEEKLRWSLEVLRRTIQQRRELALRLETAQEEERRRIAADIHDDPIQVMSAVDLRLAMHARARRAGRSRPRSREPAGDGARNRSNGSGRWCSSCVRRRSIGTGWWPPSRSTWRTPAKETGWTFEVVDELEDEPDPELRATLYRMAQEAVANARKHSSAPARGGAR